MTGKLKLYHKLLPILFIPICIVISIGWGWFAFAILTQKAAVSSDLYYFYRISPVVFLFYEIIISVVALGCIFFQVYYLMTSNALKLTKTFKWFGIFMTLFLITEFLLHLRYAGKG